MMQTQIQLESRRTVAMKARWVLCGTASVMLAALAAVRGLQAQSGTSVSPRYANAGCTATIQNRPALVDSNGSYVVPNVPEPAGKYRVHIVCPQPDGSILAATSDPYTLLGNDSIAIPLLPLDVPVPGVQTLRMQVQSGQLNALGATAQLSVVGFQSDGAPLEETPASTGTTYATSNPAVATVSADGLITANGPGAVSVTANNDGLTATLMLSTFSSLDSDGDGMPDTWEIANALNPYDPTDAAQDPDGDGLTNLQEYQLGTNPRVADTDGDGRTDGQEVAAGTNPLVADTDGDGLSDGQEAALGTNPLVADTDGDGIPDGVEVKIGTNPLVADATTTVSGHVTNPNGTPATGTSVVVLTYFSAVTDSTGAFSVLRVPVTLGNVVASAQVVIAGAVYSGASVSTAPISGGITDVGTIQLGQASGQVSGTIYTPDNKPDVGAVVTVVSGMDTRTAVTNAVGLYTVSGLQSGTVFVAAIDPTTSLRGQATGTLVSSAPLTLNVTLGGFGTVSGTVFDGNGKAVGAGIAVTIAGALTASTTTDTLGHYSFAFVPLGGVTVEAADSTGNRGRTTATVTATAQTINANVQYLGRGTVSGKVTDGTGTAVAGASVQLSNFGLFQQSLTATTDSVGQYSIPNVFVGGIALTATSTATSTAGTTTASLTTNAQTVTANITLQATATVSGTVYRADGTTPVGGAYVSLQGTALYANTSASGTYSVPNVPLGSYAVRAKDSSSNDQGQALVTLGTAGQTVTRNVSMNGVASVKVTVLDGAGTKTPGALVTIDSGNPFYQTQNGVTVSDGTITFNAEIAGSISVNARSPVTGLSGTATVTLGAGATASVTVNLQAAGTVRGTVYKLDGTTPVAGLTLILDGGPTTTSAADGTYSFSNVVVGNHGIEVRDRVGNRLSYNSNVTIASQGQTVTANFAIVGRGTVTGHVTNADGSAAQGVAVEVRSSGGTGGNYGTSTDVNGLYTVQLVPVGGYVVVAQQHTTTTTAYGSKGGTLTSDGSTATTDIQLSSSLVPSTLSVNDANGETYPVRENGGIFDGSYSVFAGDGGSNRGASLLALTQGSTTVNFTGQDLAPVDLGGRQISLTQTGLAGLNVTRRVYVPADGYFARYIELLNNPGASPITVGVSLTTNFRPVIVDTVLSSGTQVTQDVPKVLLTTSGDGVINVNDPITPDTWATLGGATDRDPFLPDEFADTPIPAVGFVFNGPGAAVKPSLIVYGPDSTGAFSTLKETYSSVTVPAGGTVALMHFISQQNQYAPANASAQRLVQLPPEALAGISSADLASIQNFVLPANGTSTLAPLNVATNQVTGHVFAPDSKTVVPNAQVRFQSTNPIFPRTYIATTDSGGNFNFQGSVGGLAIASDPFSLFAIDPNTATALTGVCAQAGLRNSNGCGVISPTVSGTFASGVNVASKDIVFINLGEITGTISRGPTVLNVAGTVTLTGSGLVPLTVAVRADGTYMIPNLPAGTYALVANVTNTLLTGTAAATVTAGQVTTTNITIGGAGVITGLVTRPDGSLAVNATVNLRSAGQTPLTTVVDTSGHYQFTDIPIGSYTVDCFDSGSNASATVTATVSANTTTTANLSLQSSGTVVGTVTANDGSSVANISVTLTSTTSNGTQTLTATTSATGTFTFNSVNPGAISVRAVNGDGLQGTSTGNLPLAGQTVTINVNLIAAGSLTGTVYQGDGTTPAVGITVTLDPAPLSGSSATTTTNASGVYNFSNVRLGGFTVYASNATTGDRGQSTGQIQANGQQRTINVTLAGFGSLTVKVLSASSQPVANSTVQVSAPYGTTFNGTTDTTGLVTFPNVLTGSFNVTAKDPATGYSVYSTGTLTYKATLTFTVTLQSLAAIQGTVYGVDGVTPANSITVTLSGSASKTATTGPDGKYQFASIPTGYYTVYATDSRNFVRASTSGFSLSTSGSTVTKDLTLVGVGSVTGTVKNTDGSLAENTPLTLTTQNTAVGTTYTTTTGGDGTYTFAEVPIGKLTVSVNGLPSGQIGYGTGTLTADGSSTVVNIQIQGNTITLPITLKDADGFSYQMYGDGMYYLADNFTPFSGAQPLIVTVGSTSQQFGRDANGSQVNTAAIQTLSGQGIELTAPVNGLTVTRKIYVPSDGYFARRLDMMQNPSSSPVTVTVALGTSGAVSRTVKNRLPVIATNSNGNTTVDSSILWLVDDDDNGTQPYPQTQPTVATVLVGKNAPTALASASASIYSYSYGFGQNGYTQGYESPIYKYAAVTIPANGTASFLTFTAQEATRGTAVSAAQRLDQLPPEALAGLSTTELSSIVNFVVPVTQTLSPVHPPAAGVISGHVLAGDNVTPIPNAPVYLQSTDLQYGSGTSATADAQGFYSVPSLAASTFGGEAIDPTTTTTSAMATGSFGPTMTAQTLDIPFTGTGILRGAIKTTGAEVIRTAGATLSFMCGSTYCSAGQTAATDGTFSFLAVGAPNVNLYLNVYVGTGGYFYFSQSLSTPPGQTTNYSVTLPGTGTVSGTVTNGDGSPAGGAGVYATGAAGYATSTTTDSSGHYTLSGLPADMYTITAADPVTNSQAKGTASVGQDTNATVNLQFVGTGTVVTTVKYANGGVGSGVTLYLYSFTKGTNPYAYGYTDGSGSYTFTNVPAGSFTIRAYYPNQSFYSTTTSTALTAQGQMLNLPITLTPVGTISGKMTYADGSPATSAYVYVADYQSIFSTNAQTDSAGNYAFFPVPADRLVNVSSTNTTNNSTGRTIKAQAANQQVAGDGQTLTVNLRYPGVADVAVSVLKQDGTPNTGANLYVYLKSADGTQSYNQNAGGTGTTTFRNVVEGSFVAYVVDFNNYTGFPNGSAKFTLAQVDDGTTRNVTLRAGVTGTVQGTVYAADGTTAITQNAYIELLDIDTGVTNDSGVNGSTPPNYSFAKVSTGASGFTLTPYYNNKALTALASNANITTQDQVVTKNFTLLVSAISGTVYLFDGTTPVPYANIEAKQVINGQSNYIDSTADSNGNFQIVGAVTGDVIITVSDNNGVSTQKTVTLTTDTGILSGVKINLPAVGTVMGTVYDSNGVPVMNANVNVSSTGGSNSFNTSEQTDNNGSYVATDIPVGTITVTAYKTDNSGSYPSVTGTLVNNGDTITLDVGQSANSAGTVFGTVYDGNGDPAPNASVSIVSANTPSTPITAKTDDMGMYSVSTVPLGDVTVSAKLEDGTDVGSTQGTLVSSDVSVEIDVGLQDFGIVSGTAYDANGNPLAGAKLVLESTGDPNTSYGEDAGSDGSFAFQVDQGTVTIRIEDSSGTSLGSAKGVLPYGGNLHLNVKVGAFATQVNGMELRFRWQRPAVSASLKARQVSLRIVSSAASSQGNAWLGGMHR